MAGGFGTRLRPLTNNLPKPMVPMAGRPMIDHIVELLKGHGIKDLTALLYFQPEAIVDHLKDGSHMGVKIDYVSAAADFGTAGSVANAMRSKDAGTTLVISGDVLTDIDLTKAIEFHRKNKAAATIVLTRVKDPLSFGIVITGDDGRIERFLEKPSWGEVFSDTINTGIYILEKEVYDYIPEGSEFDFSKDLFPALLRDKKAIYGYIAEGYWKDVGSLDEYLLANMDILNGAVKVNIDGKETGRKGLWVGESSKVDISLKAEGTVIIGKNCSVRGGAGITNSVIGDNCVIEDGAEIMNSVLWHGVRVGRSAKLQENVVGANTVLCEGAHLGEGAIVSDSCRVGRGSSVKANVKVWPHKEVEDGATLASSLIWGQKWGRNIFSMYGVTGLANVELSPEFAAKLGAAYGASLGKGSFVSTSRDSHKTSRMINRAIMTGLLSTGVNVHDYGVTPISVVRYLARTGNEVGGIHTRRSPFDTKLIDLKFFDSSGLDLHPNSEKSIERLFFREDFRRVSIDDTGEMVFPVHGYETYLNGFLSAIDRAAIEKANFKVVLDYSYGSSSRIFPSILGKLKCDVVALSANLDADKTTRNADEFNRALIQLSTIVRSLKADIGVLLDAGGEKIFLVDDTGEIIDGETALSVITLLSLKTSQGIKGSSFAVPVTASRAVEQMAASYGVDVIKTKTTPRGIMEAATKDNVKFVGETTGGFIFPSFQPGFDGMFAVAKILEMLAKYGRKFHSLLREIPPSKMVKEKVPCPWEHKGTVMRRLAEESRGAATTLIDGIRIDFGDDWIIAYPSQTNSYFHVEAEASTEDKAREMVSLYSRKIKEWQAKT